jgi:hypothetical protein
MEDSLSIPVVSLKIKGYRRLPDFGRSFRKYYIVVNNSSLKYGVSYGNTEFFYTGLKINNGSGGEIKSRMSRRYLHVAQG